MNILCCFVVVVGCTHALNEAPEEWQRTLEIRTTSSFLRAQAFARAHTSFPIMKVGSASEENLNRSSKSFGSTWVYALRG